jgi:hypothetical protein
MDSIFNLLLVLLNMLVIFTQCCNPATQQNPSSRSIHSFLRKDFTFLRSRSWRKTRPMLVIPEALSLSKEEQVRLVISMSDRKRDNVSQKLIWYQK